MVFTIPEIMGIIVVAFYTSYIFSAFIKKPRAYLEYDSPTNTIFEDMKFAAYIVVPAVILHEMAHKFTALALGFSSEFMAFYQSGWTLGLAIFSIVLRVIHAPFIILVPGFVLIPANVDPISTGMIAFAGPLTNIILYGIAAYLLKSHYLNHNQAIIAHLTKRVNLWLFIFNMIPIGIFDGAKVLNGIIYALSGTF